MVMPGTGESDMPGHLGSGTTGGEPQDCTTSAAHATYTARHAGTSLSTKVSRTVSCAKSHHRNTPRFNICDMSTPNHSKKAPSATHPPFLPRLAQGSDVQW